MFAHDTNSIIVNFSKNKKIYKKEHTHPNFSELYLLVKGKMFNHVNGKKQKVEAPAIVFVRQSDVHYIERVDNDECCFYLIMIGVTIYDNLKTYFSVPDVFNQMEALPHSPISLLSNRSLMEIEYCIKKLLKYQNEKTIIATVMQKELLLKCFAAMLEHYMGQKDISIPLWFRNILFCVTRKEVIDQGVSSLVRITGKSNPYLCKYFKKYLNTNPTAYINNVRMEKAAVLLKTSDMEIIEIAFDVGFNNLSYFYHIFKQKYQISPAKYRSLHQNTFF